MMKKIKLGKKLINIGILIYFIENFYYGWNLEPMNNSELFQDYVYSIFIFSGIFIYFTPFFKLYEDIIKKQR